MKQSCTNCFFRRFGYDKMVCSPCSRRLGYCHDWKPKDENTKAEPQKEVYPMRVYRFRDVGGGDVFVLATTGANGYERLLQRGIRATSKKHYRLIWAEEMPDLYDACVKNGGWSYGKF